MRFGVCSDTGCVREHNEDAVGSKPEIGLMVLADGMGGYNAGEVASGMYFYRLTTEDGSLVRKMLLLK